jgi:hypothetical protein
MAHPPDQKEFYPVSREVNSPAVDQSNDIEPLKQGHAAYGWRSTY